MKEFGSMYVNFLKWCARLSWHWSGGGSSTEFTSDVQMICDKEVQNYSIRENLQKEHSRWKCKCKKEEYYFDRENKSERFLNTEHRMVFETGEPGFKVQFHHFLGLWLEICQPPGVYRRVCKSRILAKANWVLTSTVVSNLHVPPHWYTDPRRKVALSSFER